MDEMNLVETNPKIIKTFAFVNDLTPTILDYAGIHHTGSTYKGHEVHTIMGKSMKSLLNGTADRIYGEDEIVADEMFNNSAVYMGDWKATKHPPPIGDGKWQLHNIETDPGQNNNVASQYPEIMQKMIDGYNRYAKDVGVVPPIGQKFYNLLAFTVPPLNQSQVTITYKDIAPANFTTAMDNTTTAHTTNTNEVPTTQEIHSLLHS